MRCPQVQSLLPGFDSEVYLHTQVGEEEPGSTERPTIPTQERTCPRKLKESVSPQQELIDLLRGEFNKMREYIDHVSKKNKEEFDRKLELQRKQLQSTEERTSPPFLDFLRGEFSKMHDHIKSIEKRTNPQFLRLLRREFHMMHEHIDYVSRKIQQEFERES